MNNSLFIYNITNKHNAHSEQYITLIEIQHKSRIPPSLNVASKIAYFP